MSMIYTSGDATLRYMETGSGLPVVFLHPTPLNHDYWRPLIGELKDVHAIAPDFRGHGGSELGSHLRAGAFEGVPDAPVLTMRQLALDVLALLDKIGVPQAVFLGCSIGGYVLLELWRHAPQRMLGLGFICSKPQADAEAARAKRAETIAKVRQDGVAAFLDATAGTLPGATTRRERPEVVADIRRQMTLSADAAVAVQAGLAARPDSIDTVATITVPVLAIAGGEDSAISPADMEAFKAAYGGCAYHLLPRAGHLAAFEQPREVAALVTPWLQRFRDPEGEFAP